MTYKTSNISVVIPAYNEEKHIGTCLSALNRQTVKPLEIIVVNNNSTDLTVAIARKFKNVTIIHEKQQGLIYARNKGFDAAKGKIIARLDADCIAPDDWINKINLEFKKDKLLVGITGFGYSYEGPYKFLSSVVSWFYFKHCLGFFGSKVLWGGNMSITKKAWELTKNDSIVDDFIHEDEDLSLAISSNGYKIRINPRLYVFCNHGGIQYLDKFHKYNKMKYNTRKLHRLHKRSNYVTIYKIGLINRVFLRLLTEPSVALMYILVSFNSGYRFIKQKKDRYGLAIFNVD